jgi:hypothetical protein
MADFSEIFQNSKQYYQTGALDPVQDDYYKNTIQEH